MRLWTLHPRHLDARGLVALWREALLAQAVHDEAAARGYRFDAGKIGPVCPVEPLPAAQGQLDFEWRHLKTKLLLRAPAWLERWAALVRPDPHPLFHLTPGPVADWEVATRNVHDR